MKLKVTVTATIEIDEEYYYDTYLVHTHERVKHLILESFEEDPEAMLDLMREGTSFNIAVEHIQ